MLYSETYRNNNKSFLFVQGSIGKVDLHVNKILENICSGRINNFDYAENVCFFSSNKILKIPVDIIF